ncbi:MAG: CoA-transferase [Acetobacteraceae bacterium]
MSWLTHGLVAAVPPVRAGRVISAATAAALVRDGDTIAVGGGLGGVDGVPAAMEARFLQGRSGPGGPQGLTLICVSDQRGGRARGINHLAHPGLLKRLITGSWSQPMGFRELAASNRLEAYALPQGAIVHMLRASVAQRPGYISKVGLGTPADPRRGGGKLNLRTRDDLVQVVTVAGSDALMYSALLVDVALIQGLVSDRAGNLAVRRSVAMEVHAVASAARVNGGLVIAQVQQVVTPDEMPSDAAVIAGGLIDHVVVTPRADRVWETFAEPPPLWAGASRPLSLPSG